MSHDIPTESTVEREPSVLDTAIRVESVERLEQLKAKLAEYEERQAAKPEVDILDAKVTYTQAKAYFKSLILRYVINEIESGRDTATGNPIVVTELILAAHDNAGVHFGGAVLEPFVFDEDALSYRPNFDKVRLEPILDRAFLEAYAIIMSYANDGGVNVGDGTGLPEVS